MKETMGWVVTGVLAGVAMFSLATARDPAPSMNDPVQTKDGVPLATLEGPSSVATALADAYFSIARSDEGAANSQADWLVRHQITLKGFDAEQGLQPQPESPENRGLSKADEATLANAYALVEAQNQHNTQSRNPPKGDVIALSAALQAQYDWWLLGTEAGWAPKRLDNIRARFHDTLSALETARTRDTLAAL